MADKDGRAKSRPHRYSIAGTSSSLRVAVPNNSARLQFLTLSNVLAICVRSVEVGKGYTSIRVIQLDQCYTTYIRDVPAVSRPTAKGRARITCKRGQSITELFRSTEAARYNC
jgi:hypothetical protein